jgi:hypothetical protein
MEVNENRPIFQSYIAELAAVKAIVFGDRFLAPRFRAETHNWLVKRLVSSKAEAWNQTIIYAFEHLASDDKLLSFFTEMHARHFEEMGVVDESKKEDGDDEMVQVEDDLESELPIEFLVSCMKKMALLRAPSQGTADVHNYRMPVSDLEEEELQNAAVEVSLVNLKSGGGVGLNITATSVVDMKCAQQ